jgi:hypothetical protein
VFLVAGLHRDQPNHSLAILWVVETSNDTHQEREVCRST